MELALLVFEGHGALAFDLVLGGGLLVVVVLLSEGLVASLQVNLLLLILRLYLLNQLDLLLNLLILRLLLLLQSCYLTVFSRQLGPLSLHLLAELRPHCLHIDLLLL